MNEYDKLIIFEDKKQEFEKLSEYEKNALAARLTDALSNIKSKLFFDYENPRP